MIRNLGTLSSAFLYSFLLLFRGARVKQELRGIYEDICNKFLHCLLFSFCYDFAALRRDALERGGKVSRLEKLERTGASGVGERRQFAYS